MTEEAMGESLETISDAENTEEEQAVQDDEVSTDDTPEDIAEAKKFGFKTAEDYSGNPDFQVSAKEYLARKQKGGIIKEKDETISNLQSEIAETTKAVNKMAQFHERQLQRTREDALVEARTKYVKAVDNDGISGADALDAYEQDKSKIDTQYTQYTEPKEAANNEEPEIAKFNQANPWLYDDVVMRGAANAILNDIADKYPVMPLSERLDRVKKQVVERFPDKFENPKKGNQVIEPGGNIHGGAVRRRETLQSLGFSAADITDVKKSIQAGEFKNEADFIKYYKGAR